MTTRETVTKSRCQQDIVVPDDVVTHLASLGYDAKVEVRLDWRPVRPGSFSIPGVGVRDYADGWLYDTWGERCGSLDYKTGKLLVSVGTLRRRRDWLAIYDYDHGLTSGTP